MRIAFISPCGYGNLGDVAIQDAFIDGARHQLGPETEIVGITQNPADTVERHHVPALPMDTYAFRLRSRGSPADVATVPPKKTTSSTFSRTRESAKVVVKELVHWRIALREMRRVDLLVVSGGGQLDDHWGGPWRVPYALWKWSLAAKLFRRDVVVLSVGAGTIGSGLTRYFLRSALRRARYVSFRDRRTAALAHSLRLSSSTRVVPDLAFGHVDRRGARPAENGRARPVVAISPIAYLDPAAWPAKDARAYRANLERTAELTGLLLARGYDVLLCSSDTPDTKSAAELLDAVVDVDDGDKGVLELVDTPTPADLLAVFGRADVAVASRLHGLIMANLAGAPTVALSYDWKVDEHMRTMGLERYTFPIGSFAPEVVAAAAAEILTERETLASSVAQRCATFAAQVDAQFGEALGS